MRTLYRIGLILLAISLVTITAVADDVRVPFDKGGNLLTYTSEHEQRFNLFPGIQNLIKAELYLEDGGSYILEIQYDQGGSQKRQRRVLTEDEVDAIRETISLEMQRVEVRLDEGDERTRFLVGTSLLGLGYYGWSIPLSIDVNDGTTALAMYMMVSGASFYYPYWVTQDRTVTPAMARLGLYGGTRGIAHGFMLGLAMDQNPSSEMLFFLANTLSIAELVTGFTVARNSNYSTGTAESIALMGDMGLAWGIGGAAALEMEEAGISALGLVGSFLGVSSGTWIGNRFDLSAGDVRAVQAATMLGALAPVTVGSAIYGDKLTSQQVAALLTFGSAVGTWYGLHRSGGTHFAEGRGNLIRLSTSMGALTGTGIVYIVNPETDTATPYLIGATIGGFVGYSMMYKTQLQLHGPGNRSLSIRTDFNPLGLMAMNAKHDGRYRYHPPIASLTVRF
ncbi:hypothetical protein KQI63_10455 [bacterium]|nr:hypothetical protein [bacterium]